MNLKDNKKRITIITVAGGIALAGIFGVYVVLNGMVATDSQESPETEKIQNNMEIQKNQDQIKQYLDELNSQEKNLELKRQWDKAQLEEKITKYREEQRAICEFYIIGDAKKLNKCLADVELDILKMMRDG